MSHQQQGPPPGGAPQGPGGRVLSPAHPAPGGAGADRAGQPSPGSGFGPMPSGGELAAGPHGPQAWAPPPAVPHQVHAAAGGAGLPDPDRARRTVGLILTLLGCLGGASYLAYALSSAPDFNPTHLERAALIAYLPVGLYLFVPFVIDRYDPEPWWALLGVFLWGAMFATGLSYFINTTIGVQAATHYQDAAMGRFIGSAISAPIIEELTKGMAIFGMVYFFRREFDGVVDGIIYGTFVALGFAATENIIYYARFHETLGDTFYLRGVLTPWIHPLFTATIGIGFGLGREHGATWAKVVYPLAGYGLGVLFHACWNGIPQIYGPAAFVLNLIVGTLMAFAFFVMICVLVYRKGVTIKTFLEDEVLVGTITQEEFELITSYGGRLKARLSWRGRAGAAFVRAGARLALSKWHTVRAEKGKKRTLSADFIVPLRQEMARLRQVMNAQAN